MSATDVTPSRKRFSLQLPPRAWNFGLLAATVSMDMSLGLSQLATNLLAVTLGASAFHLGLKGVIWCIPYVVFCPLSGRLSDRAGRKRIAQAAAILLMFLYLALTKITSLRQLLIITPFCGLATGVFWPPIQSWVGDLRTGELGSAVGKFNIAWSSAAMLGTLLAGFLSEIDAQTPLLIAALSMALITSLISLVPESPAIRDRSEKKPKTAQSETRRPSPETHRAFLQAARVANLVAFIGIGTITTFFPKLGADLDLGPSVIGMVISTFALGRVLTFAVLAHTTRWQYHGPLLAVALFVSAVAMGLAAVGNTLWMLGCCFALMGIVGGVTYMTSLFYALDAPAHSGANAGIHESLLSAGMGISALFGGIVAQVWGLRSPFAMSSVALIVASGWVARRLILHPPERLPRSEHVPQDRERTHASPSPVSMK
ncbi:MAG: MFS transporter [Limnochordia bacterium]|jgi:DHA1 family multidrug resistance protein-like MFS transporter